MTSNAHRWLCRTALLAWGAGFVALLYMMAARSGAIEPVANGSGQVLMWIFIATTLLAQIAWALSQTSAEGRRPVTIYTDSPDGWQVLLSLTLISSILWQVGISDNIIPGFGLALASVVFLVSRTLQLRMPMATIAQPVQWTATGGSPNSNAQRTLCRSMLLVAVVGLAATLGSIAASLGLFGALGDSYLSVIPWIVIVTTVIPQLVWALSQLGQEGRRPVEIYRNSGDGWVMLLGLVYLITMLSQSHLVKIRPEFPGFWLVQSSVLFFLIRIWQLRTRRVPTAAQAHSG